MRLLITGSKGQLGTELTRQALAHDVTAVDYQELDITNAAAVTALVQKVRPDVVINAAAYTAVDRAEQDEAAAFAVNRDGAAHLAQACHAADIPLVHVSTDYVFDGSQSEAYQEDDALAPLGVYGRSKAEGDDAVRQFCGKHLIFRTSWVFSAHGNNFVKTMLRLGAERETLGVVADQYGKPTSAAELARVILAVLPHMDGHWGTYHLAQPEAVTWHGFASAIFAEARLQGVPLVLKQLNAISTADYPTPAKRPVNSALNCAKLEKTFDVSIRPWSESLTEVIREMREVR
jgi:dTDP-4-dehydrorhamnose reductase